MVDVLVQRKFSKAPKSKSLKPKDSEAKGIETSRSRRPRRRIRIQKIKKNRLKLEDDKRSLPKESFSFRNFIQYLIFLFFILPIILLQIYRLYEHRGKVLQKFENVDSVLESFIRSDSTVGMQNFDFSACLVLGDEDGKKKLPEWIAYHYHVAQLRNLVICRDCSNVTSPIEIVRRWNGADKMDMNIEIWANDAHIKEKQHRGAPPQKATIKEIEIRNLARQRHCYRACLEHHQKNGKTWTMLLSIDEYLTFNSISNDDRDDLFYLDKNVSKNDHFSSPYKVHNIKTSDEIKRKRGFRQIKSTQENLDCLRGRTRLPLNLGYKTIVEFMIEEKNNVPWKNNDVCMVFPKLHYFSSMKGGFKSRVPNEFDIQHFKTLNMFKHSGKKIFENGAGRIIIDVSRISTPIRPKKKRFVFSRHFRSGMWWKRT